MERLFLAYEGAGQWEAAAEILHRLRNDINLKPHLSSSSLDLLDREISIREAGEFCKIESGVEAARYRLGAPPYAQLKEQVKATVYQASLVDQLIHERLKQQPDSTMAEQLLLRLEIKIPHVKDTTQKVSLFNVFLSVAQEYSNTPYNSELAKQILAEYSDRSEREDLESLAQEEGTGTLVTLLRELNFTIKEHDWNQVLMNIQKLNAHLSALNLDYGLPTPHLNRLLARWNAMVLTRTDNFFEAIPQLESLTKDNIDWECRQLLAYCYRRQGQIDSAITYLKQLILDLSIIKGKEQVLIESWSDLGWLHYQKSEYDQAEECLEKATLYITSGTTVTAELYSKVLVRLALANWEMTLFSNKTALGNRSASIQVLNRLMEAVQVNANCFAAFAYLGEYYEKVEKDQERALCCYTRALTLNNERWDVAVSLANLWLQNPNHQSTLTASLGRQTIQLLEPFTVHSDDNEQLDSRNKIKEEEEWPFQTTKAQLWQTLGLAYLSIGEAPAFSSAAVAFQMALKDTVSINELRCLLGLAEAYRREGRFHASRQVYQQVRERWPESKTASWGLAMVQVDLQEYSLARDSFLSLANQLNDHDRKNDLKHDNENENYYRYYQYEATRMGMNQVKWLLSMGCIYEAMKLVVELMEEMRPRIEKWTGVEGYMIRQLLADTLLLPLQLAPLRISKTISEGHLNELVNVICQICNQDNSHTVTWWSDLMLIIDQISSLPSPFIIMIKIICGCHWANIMAVEKGNLPTITHSWANLASILLLGLSILPLVSVAAKGQCRILSKVQEAIRHAGSIPDYRMQLIRALFFYHQSDYGQCQHYLIKALQEGAGADAWIPLAILYQRIGERELARRAQSRVLVENADPLLNQGVIGHSRKKALEFDWYHAAWAWAMLCEAHGEREAIMGGTMTKEQSNAYENKVIQASQVSPIYAHPIHGLALNVILRIRPTTIISMAMLKELARRRIAFGAPDKMAKQVLAISSTSESSPRHPLVIMAAQAMTSILKLSPNTEVLTKIEELKNQLESLSQSDEDALILVNILDVVATPLETAVPLPPAISSLEPTLSLSMSTDQVSPDLAEYRALERTIDFCERNQRWTDISLWSDLQLWHNQCKALGKDRISGRRLIEWLRMRMTGELVGKLGDARVAEIILKLIEEMKETTLVGLIPDDIQNSLQLMIRFHYDLSRSIEKGYC